jgi:hypothetical protein
MLFSGHLIVRFNNILNRFRENNYMTSYFYFFIFWFIMKWLLVKFWTIETLQYAFDWLIESTKRKRNQWMNLIIKWSALYSWSGIFCRMILIREKDEAVFCSLFVDYRSKNLISPGRVRQLTFTPTNRKNLK